MPNQKNIKTVEELKEKIAKAKSITFADYLGLKVNSINELRNKIKEEEAEMTIARNTLVKIALKEQNEKVSPQLEEDLKGPTAVIFSYSDAIAPIKTLFEFAKDFELPKVKSALVDGIYNDASQVEVLSKLPSREELIARVVGGLKAPLSGIANVLGGSQRKLVYTLANLAKKREGV